MLILASKKVTQIIIITTIIINSHLVEFQLKNVKPITNIKGNNHNKNYKTEHRKTPENNQQRTGFITQIVSQY